MSTVLWANLLLDNGEVVSDERDKWALYQYAEKLDQFARVAKVKPFSSLLDHTDIEANIIDDALPEDVISTNALMASEGVWTSADEALVILNAILALIRTEKPKFGLLKNDAEAVVAELSESIEYATKASEMGAKFNFSVVM